MKLHHRAKLTAEEVEAMRIIYEWIKPVNKNIGYGKISGMFLCGESTVRDIVQYRTR